MLEKFNAYIRSQQIIEQSDKVLIAISGGIDSVCLADLFYRAGINFGLAHCNFQLRGELSDQDQQFVSSLAKKYQVPFHTINFDTEQYAVTNEESIQMAARKLRYDWFNEIVKSNEYQKLATAHHLNDSLETTLFNLAKGTGIAGLRGIKTIHRYVIRPLLFATKSMIEDYAKEHKIEWREDLSNASDKYSRNYIRQNIVPALVRINPSIESNFHETMDRISAVEKIYKEHLSKIKEKHLREDGSTIYLGLGFVKEQSDYVHVFELIRSFGFSLRQTKEITSVDTQTGASFYSKNYWLVKNRNELVITPDTTDDISYQIHEDTKQLQSAMGLIQFETLNVPPFIANNPSIAQLDFDKLKFPLKIRNWEKGEKFSPLGMKGKKKISDFMIDHKIAVNLKKSYKVLISDEKIVWLMGLRMDNNFKITENTRKVYQIEITNNNV